MATLNFMNPYLIHLIDILKGLFIYSITIITYYNRFYYIFYLLSFYTPAYTHGSTYKEL